MSKLWTLVKLNFKALLSAVKLGNSKKAKAGGLGAIIFLAAISLYISGIYSFLFGDMLSKAGLLEFLIPLISIVGFAMTIIMTVTAASGFVFSNRDSDLMLSLPISAFSVMLSKILALYLECLIFCALFVLPSGIAYIFYGGAWGVGFIIRLILGSVLLPVLATLFCVILGWLFAWITAHSKNKSLIATLVSFVFLGAIFYYSFQLNTLATVLLNNKDQFNALLSSWLLPFGLMQTGITSSWLDFILFSLLCLVPFLLVVWVFSAFYKKILSGLASHSVRDDYKLKEVKATGAFLALFKKEARRYFGTTIYITNTAVGAIIMLGAAIYACIAKDSIAELITQMGGINNLIPLALAIFGFCIGMTNTTCVSISLEGKTLWILKEAPIAAETIFKSKLAVNLLVTVPVIIISMAILSVSYSLDALTAVSMTLVLLAFTMANSLFGLLINLHFPKMDCDNDTIVVKQSASAFFGYFSGLIFIAVFALLYNFALKSVGIATFCLIATAILIVICCLFWYRLSTWGKKKLITL